MAQISVKNINCRNFLLHLQNYVCTVNFYHIKYIDKTSNKVGPKQGFINLWIVNYKILFTCCNQYSCIYYQLQLLLLYKKLLQKHGCSQYLEKKDLKEVLPFDLEKVQAIGQVSLLLLDSIRRAICRTRIAYLYSQYIYL